MREASRRRRTGLAGRGAAGATDPAPVITESERLPCPNLPEIDSANCDDISDAEDAGGAAAAAGHGISANDKSTHAAQANSAAQTHVAIEATIRFGA